MHVVGPGEAVHADRRRAGVIVEPLADVVSGSVGLAAENDVGRGLHNGIKFLMFLAEFEIELLKGLASLFQFFGAFGNPLLQLPVQAFQLHGLAMQFGKQTDLGAQQLRHHRNGNVVTAPRW